MKALEVARGEEDAIVTEALTRLKLRPQIVESTRYSTQWNPEPYQMPPPDWLAGVIPDWLFRGGRGSGKTRTGAEAVLEHLREHGGPHCRVGVGGVTISDVRDISAEGDSGLMTIARHEFTTYNRSMGEATHYSGGRIKMLGSEEPNRWNGPQWCFLWRDELALWNKDSFDQSEFGLRLKWTDKHGRERIPQSVNTTTPKSRKFVREFEGQSTTATTHGRMEDNPHLSIVARRKLELRYGGTRLGRQELGGEYVLDVEGALWQRNWIEDGRLHEAPCGMQRIVVAIDPAVTSSDASDETGISVAGLGDDGDFYVFEVSGYRLSPQGWALRAIDLYDKYQADRMVAERNNGGEMVESTIRQVRRGIALRTIVATRGKQVRAEPIAALYEQGRVHHLGTFEEAEDQMCSFPVENELDDLVDALVWSLTELDDGSAGSVWILNGAATPEERDRDRDNKQPADKRTTCCGRMERESCCGGVL